MIMEKTALKQRLDELGRLLISELKPQGYWEGKLSSSALAVAVSVTALHFDDKAEHAASIEKGLNWLKNNINRDGSFGDTPDSPGNVSTSLLVYAAANLYAEQLEWITPFQHKVAGYLLQQGIEVNSSQVSEAILTHYQNDYTFSVPILAMCGLCGIPGKDAFDHIPQLPFELALLPRPFYRLLNLSVVSYAIPALVAVGIVIFKKKSSAFLWKNIRRFSIPRALNILHRMLPDSGGFLEASPLTAFVALSLINAGYKDTEVVKRGIYFLKTTQREDGSWPIDVDLSTWVTSLSVKCFRSHLTGFLTTDWQDKITDHFKLIQNDKVHPFNGTSPGGWGWTNFPGSVPDGDDTPGVIISLLKLQPKSKVRKEILAGCKWLLKLQNQDGGFPTFSRGWGKLPFDQSCSDLTGHNLLALSSVIDNYYGELSATQRKKLVASFLKALQYLKLHQHKDGSWLPLWFGNQLAADHTNPVYGTAKVVAYLRDASEHSWLPDDVKEQLLTLIKSGAGYLIAVQNEDNSWGGGKNIPGTIEETSWAISALLTADNLNICLAGFEWLEATFKNKGLAPAPVGLYFASLWYHEKLYPVTAYVEALARALELPED